MTIIPVRDQVNFRLTLFGERIFQVVVNYFPAVTYDMKDDDVKKIGNYINHPKRKPRKGSQKEYRKRLYCFCHGNMKWFEIFKCNIC